MISMCRFEIVSISNIVISSDTFVKFSGMMASSDPGLSISDV